MEKKGKTMFIYDKEQSLLISGVAVLFMVVHHVLGFDYLRLEENSLVPFLEIHGISLGKVFAAFGKICVSVFAFNTGYVIWKKREIYTFANNVKRILKFLLCYWVVYSLFLIVGFVYNEQMPVLSDFFLNLIGLRTGTFVNFVNVPYAWYVCFYVFFVLSSPFIIWLFSRGNKICMVAFFIWLTLSQLLSIITLDGVLGDILRIYISVGTPALSGILFSKYHLFDAFSMYIPTKLGLYGILYVCLIVVRQLSVYLFGANFLDVIFAPLFIFLSVNIIYFKNIFPILNGVFKLLGKYSMNIWFLHGLFFTGSMHLQWILYLPKYSTFVLIWGMSLLIVISGGVTFIQNPILKIIGIQK